MKRLCLLFFLLITTTLFAQTMGEWTWMKGSNTNNSPGVFGIKGVPDPANHPPALYEACSWTDNEGNFWLFGGAGYNTIYNTLWKFTSQNTTWTWISGSNIPFDNGNYGIKGIPSSTNCPSSKGYGIMTWVDKNNNLWLLGGATTDGAYQNLWKYDISTNEWTWESGTDSNTYITNFGIKGVPSQNNFPPPIQENNCTWVDSYNNLLFYGGLDGQNYYNDLWQYNIANNEWLRIFGDATPNYPIIFGQRGVSDINNNPGGQCSYASFSDTIGNLYFFGSGSDFFGPLNILNDIWKYDRATNLWTWISGDCFSNSLGIYGSVCIPGNNNEPRSRFEVRASWTDDCGFWIYGGFIDHTGTSLSDFWRYDFTNNSWTRISGTINTNEPPVYGNYQISSPANTPGGRGGSVSWMDKKGNLWLYGGMQGGSNGGVGFDDLWRFVPDPGCVKLCIPQNDTTQDPKIIIPNFLTPNADGINDVFAIIAKNYIAYRLIVFNRWGNEVFQSNDTSKLWNGREQNNGKECADGVYFYILNLTDNKQVETQHKGSVTILR